MKHRCQMCTDLGRKRTFQGSVLYLCKRHWRQVSSQEAR